MFYTSKNKKIMIDNINNIVIDTDYSKTIPGNWYVNFVVPVVKKEWFFDKILNSLFWWWAWKPSRIPWMKKPSEPKPENTLIKDKDLRDQVKYILELPDADYNDKMLTSKLREFISEVQTHYSSTIWDYKSHIAPSYREFKWNQFNVGWLLGKSYYAQSYPSYIDALRTRDLLSFHGKRDMTFFIYPDCKANLLWKWRCNK